MRTTHNITSNESHSPAPFVGVLRHYPRKSRMWAAIGPSLLGIGAFLACVMALAIWFGGMR